MAAARQNGCRTRRPVPLKKARYTKQITNKYQLSLNYARFEPDSWSADNHFCFFFIIRRRWERVEKIHLVFESVWDWKKNTIYTRIDLE